MPRSASIGPEKGFSCPICKKRFTNKQKKDAHVLVVHENSGRFKCGHCDRTFQQKSSMERHERTHAGEKPFSCPVCKKRFTRKEIKDAHVVVVHKNSGRFKCGHCDRTFENKAKMEIHKRLHTGEKPFRCRICKMQFAQKVHLKNHHLSKHSEKKFNCPTCDKAFGTESYLKQHLLVHSEEKPFECEKCQKRFARKGHLKSHLVVHSDDRPFRCDQCTASFKYQITLDTHQVIHWRAQLKASGSRSLVQGTSQEERVAEQPNGDQASGSQQCGLRARRRSTNYKAGQDDEESDEGSESSSTEDGESSGEDQDHESKESCSDEEAVGREDELNEMPAKRLKTENRVPDEVVPALDDPVVASQRIVKREPNSDGQTGDDRPTIISSDESEEEAEMQTESSTLTNPKLKLVFDVEYRAPC